MRNQTNIEKRVYDNNVLDSLGKFLNDKQKNYVRSTLKSDILFDLKSHIN